MLEIAVVAVLAYGGAVAVLFALQERLLFPRHATAPTARVLADAEPWSLTVDGGIVLHGVHVPAREEHAPLVLGFSGNAWNAEDFAGFLADALGDADVVAFHYRGYPPSGGRPSERALAADALAITDAMAARWPERRPVLVGFSVGTGVAAHVLPARPVAGAVLVSPFDSIRAIARRRYPWVPVGALLRHPFDSAARLAAVDRPVAVLRAGRDELVPPSRTQALVDRLPRVVYDRTFADADHGSIYDAPGFAEALREAVRAVRAGK